MKLTGPRPEQPAFYQTLGRRLVYNHPNLTLVFGPGPGRLRRAANPALHIQGQLGDILETPLTCQASGGYRTPVSVGVNGIAPGAAIGMPPRRDHTMRTCTVIGARSRMRPRWQQRFE